MRIKINIYLILGFFIILNILLFFFIYYIAVLSGNSRIFDISLAPKNSTVAFLEEDVNELRVNSRAFVIYEPSSRTVIDGKNEYLRFSPASSLKIMTAIIALEEYPLNKIISSDGVNSIVGSSMNLFEGELITVENLLYGLMLPSGNDAAYVLAKDYIGGREQFIKRMNSKARELSLINSYFVDPAGIENENYSTAFDMARLATYAMKNEKFREIVKTREKTVTDLSGNRVHELENLNQLLVIPEVIGVKTGFTEEAGGVLITAVEKGNKMYIIVVLNSPDRFADTKEIMVNAVQNIRWEAY